MVVKLLHVSPAFPLCASAAGPGCIMHEHSVNLSIPNMSLLLRRLICRPSFSKSDVRGVFLLCFLLFFHLISRPLGRAVGAAAQVVGAAPPGICSVLTPSPAHFDALSSIPPETFFSPTRLLHCYSTAIKPVTWFDGTWRRPLTHSANGSGAQRTLCSGMICSAIEPHFSILFSL